MLLWFAHITNITPESCVKLCLMLEMLITVKYMNTLHYYCDRAYPSTNICVNLYTCDICKIVHAVDFRRTIVLNRRDIQDRVR